MTAVRGIDSDHRERRVVGGDGIELSVVERGDAARSTVVLVHGYPDQQHVWDPVAERLAADHHVVTYDVRGAGRSGVPANVDGYRLDLLVADFVAVVDAVAPGRQVHLVGHDWGSIQCWEIVCTPGVSERVGSFTSISGPSLDHVGQWIRRRTSFWPTVGQLVGQAAKSWYVVALQSPVTPMLWRRVIWRRLPPVLVRTEGVEADDEWPGSTLAEDGANGTNLYRANIHERVRRPRSRRTSVPTQVIAPLEDRYVTPAMVRGLVDFGESVVVREVAGGHWIVRRRPERVARWIEDHISANPTESYQ